jgi:O-antigen ligase
MTKTFSLFERILLTYFPLFYGMLILPADISYDVFISPKVYALGIFIIIITCLRAVNSKGTSLGNIHRVVLTQPHFILALLLFLVSLVLSVTLSNYKLIAMFGSPGSRTGALFICLISLTFWLYSSSKEVSRNGLMIFFILFNILTIFEYLGFRPLSFITELNFKLDTTYPAVTVGYRGQVAGLSLLLSLLPLYWFHGHYRSWQFWFFFILGCTALGCTTNSSAIISLTLALILFAVINKSNLKILVISILAVALVSMNAYRPLSILGRHFYSIGWTKGQPDSKNITNTVTIETRLILWHAGLNMFKDKPLLGWGPQTYNQQWYNFTSKADGDRLFRLEMGLTPKQKMARIGDASAYLDQEGKSHPLVLNYVAPHNAIIDILYSQGIIGFLALILFFILLLRYLFKQSNRNILIALLPFFAYTIYLLGWFITVPATGFCAILLGMTISNMPIKNKNIPSI